MAVTTTYTCDRCGHKQDEEEQLWTVAVAIRHGTNIPHNCFDSPRSSALWCRRCAEDMGLLIFSEARKNKGEKLPEPMTLEEQIGEVIRTIVREELYANQSNG
jgi:hypothetical protein